MGQAIKEDNKEIVKEKEKDKEKEIVKEKDKEKDKEKNKEIDKEKNKEKDKKNVNFKDENIEFHFIYFIESHDKSKTLKIYLSPDYQDSDTLEKLEEKELSEENYSLIYNLYRFKLFPDNYEQDKKEVEIKVIIEEKKMKNVSNISKYIIKINDIHKDFYDYNFKTEQITPIKLTYEQKFEIFVGYLRKKLKKLQSSKENKEFILSTLSLLQENKHDFLFYILIFLECFSTQINEKLLLFFHPKKIKEIGKVSEVKFKQMNGVLNNLCKNPERLKVEKEESRKEITDRFYFIYFYFNVIFKKDKIEEIFENEKIFTFRQILISNVIIL